MTRDEIIEKFRTRKGFLKKGAQWLADKWGVDIAIIKDCKNKLYSNRIRELPVVPPRGTF